MDDRSRYDIGGQLRGVDLRGVRGVELLGDTAAALDFSTLDGRLSAELPPELPVSATHVLRLAGAAG
ncbi:hypothetical protein GS539_21205 [Rhodococcus hoagii]|nr:hypothetical protein [Prescottella equi]